MTAPAPAEAVREAAVPLDTRLATRISGPVDQRLRLAALVQRTPLGQFLDHVLDQALPPVNQIADQIRGATSDEH